MSKNNSSSGTKNASKRSGVCPSQPLVGGLTWVQGWTPMSCSTWTPQSGLAVAVYTASSCPWGRRKSVGPTLDSTLPIITSAMQAVYHEVRDTPPQLVFLDLAKIDAVLTTSQASTLPQGLNLDKSNLALLRGFGVGEHQLLASAAKHNLLASRIASPSPGTSQHTAWVHTEQDFVQAGPLAGLRSTVNMVGYARIQLVNGQKIGAATRRAKSVVYQSLGLSNSPRTPACRVRQSSTVYHKATMKKRRDANAAAGLTTKGTNCKQKQQNAHPNPYCHSCGVTETPKWRCGKTLCNTCGTRIARVDKKAASMGL